MSVYKRKILRTYSGEELRDLNGLIFRTEDKTEISDSGADILIRYPLVCFLYRISVLNEDESVSHEIPAEDIVLKNSSYKETYQQGLRRTLTLALINSDNKYLPSIKKLWINSKLQFEVGIKYGEAEKWYKKGVYVISSYEVFHTVDQQYVMLNLSDKWERLSGRVGTLSSTYEIPVGSNVKEAMQGILNLECGSNQFIDKTTMIFDAMLADITTPYTVTKDANSTLGELMLELATILNAECYYDEYGHLTTAKINETSNDYNKPIVWSYRTDENEASEHSGLSLNYDFSNAVNEVYVIGDNINGNLAVGVAENNNYESPLCIDLIGRRSYYLTDNNISTDAQALDRASYELRKVSILLTQMSISSYFIPHLNVNTIIEIDDIEMGWFSEKFIINSISFNLEGSNEMSLSCSNLKNLPFS